MVVERQVTATFLGLRAIWRGLRHREDGDGLVGAGATHRNDRESGCACQSEEAAGSAGADDLHRLIAIADVLDRDQCCARAVTEDRTVHPRALGRVGNPGQRCDDRDSKVSSAAIASAGASPQWISGRPS